MFAHLKGLLFAGAALGGGIYAFKRHKGMPAPTPAPPGPVAPPPPAAPPSPTAPPVPTTVVGKLVSAVSSLGGGVTSTLSNGIDVLSGGAIGQDVSGTNTTATDTIDPTNDPSNILADTTTPPPAADDGSSSDAGSIIDGALSAIGVSF